MTRELNVATWIDTTFGNRVYRAAVLIDSDTDLRREYYQWKPHHPAISNETYLEDSLEWAVKASAYHAGTVGYTSLPLISENPTKVEGYPRVEVKELLAPDNMACKVIVNRLSKPTESVETIAA